MDMLVQAALLLALFSLLFISSSQLLTGLIKTADRRLRLRLTQRRWHGEGDRTRHLGWSLSWIMRHLADLLEALNMTMSASAFAIVSGIAWLIGVGIGGLWFQSVNGLLMLSTMTAALPYLWLRMRLISRQMRARMDFLPAVEIFYQAYMMVEPRNIRQVLALCLEERRLRSPVRAPFERLFRHLSTNRPMEEALRIFSFSLGHVWGQYLTNLLRVGLTEGADISASLQELIRDMRQAQREDLRERNRLLEIRIANFSPPLFFLLFVLVNLRLNREQALYYYLIDAAGRHMVLNGLLLMFASFVMGIWLSMRRM